MGPQSERTNPALVAVLAHKPWQFDFFQAVRLLERIALEADTSTASPVGEDGPPQKESVRFRALPSHTFPPNTVTQLRGVEQFLPNRGEATQDEPCEMVVPFFGMFGPNGVLPQHYTQLIIDRVRHKDFSLRDFLDLFNHRAISFFYRAWAKYRFPVGYENNKLREDGRDDLFTFCLFCLVGLGTPGLRGRMEFDDRALLYYAPLYAQRPRSATGLRTLIGDFFQLPVKILQFFGQWLYLSESDQTQFSAHQEPEGLNCCLGTNVIVGERVWGIENKFRVQLGPLTYAQFRQFTPAGDSLLKICQWVRSYVGAEFDFDIQPVLKAEEVPPCQLGGSGDGAQLGWNTWLLSKPPVQDAYDAVFANEGEPSH